MRTGRAIWIAGALGVVAAWMAGGAEKVQVIGRETIEAPQGMWLLVSVPFENVGGDGGALKFGETAIANDLPAGSVVLFWNEDLQRWSGGVKSTRGWAPGEANHELGDGEAFFVRNNGEGALEILGAMPAAATKSRTYKGGALSIMAPMYPVGIRFGDTEVASQMPAGSSALFWDVGKQEWEGGTKSGGGWRETGARMLGVGEGFFILDAAAGELKWEQEKPYARP